jgi:hypothetical protein
LSTLPSAEEPNTKAAQLLGLRVTRGEESDFLWQRFSGRRWKDLIDLAESNQDCCQDIVTSATQTTRKSYNDDDNCSEVLTGRASQ